MRKRERILVLCVDRDNDLGEKAKVKGPVVGRDNVLKAAGRLGVVDPQDSDTNSMFQTVKVFDEMDRQYLARPAVLTGDKNVGMQSDKEISRQFSKVLKDFDADYVVLVTDGAEDENVMPIIQSRVPILSVNRVIVRQAEQLESTYFKVKDFIEETIDNPKFARLIFGLPAIALILYALFGTEGWRLIVGIFGAYLFIKGFKLEKVIYSAWDELRTSFTRRRLSFFTYIIGIALVVYATYKGYGIIGDWFHIGLFETVAAFVSASVYLYFAAGAVPWIGRGISHGTRKGKIVAVPLFGFAISLVVHNAAELILQPDVQMINFILSVVFGFALLFIALVLEWKT